ncbi:GNAT family N-acetyltransferase [Legionella bononiensis]|uniref:GNAT family N-acetyltransferase n=1 Tax=Legionella bononiensis TaxID=2793102 RepID=A0ABS1WFE6_9GAMM|nr:GNAT family N-acetyltransferase [Legionella bononiensis]MBL7479209.1 GNAT family N-acetyltransferase [Legionella bononiensis]MBL7528065.1 GNAT family N-acetyltransferase [Legionella bononiensis]MBL7563841.1 GNAT family N-acetyltransferase [Legionella bononiensis]
MMLQDTRSRSEVLANLKPDLRQHIAAFHHVEHHFFSLISCNQVKLTDLTLFATGVQASGLNPALVQQIDASFSANLTDCHSFYKEQELPWALILPDYFYSDRVQLFLEQHMMSLSDTGVAMVRSANDIPIPTHQSSLTIQEINGDLDTWSIPLIHGFESTPEVTGVYTERHKLATQQGAKIHHLSGFIDSTVVCSLTISISADSARIDDVATMPEYQNRGYATQIIHAALNYLKQLDINHCYLEASSSGLSIYQRIGFKELFKNYYYEPQ